MKPTAQVGLTRSGTVLLLLLLGTGICGWHPAFHK
jgi:hypothetical protein